MSFLYPESGTFRWSPSSARGLNANEIAPPAELTNAMICTATKA
jgi:hypothetical protein